MCPLHPGGVYRKLTLFLINNGCMKSESEKVEFEWPNKRNYIEYYFQPRKKDIETGEYLRGLYLNFYMYLANILYTCLIVDSMGRLSM